jgi:hypothetical protein
MRASNPPHVQLFTIWNESPDRTGVRVWDEVSEREGWRKVEQLHPPTPPDPDIYGVFIWKNGMVMVFDRLGDQMTKYQGHKDEVWPRLRRVLPDTANVIQGDWNKLRNR